MSGAGPGRPAGGAWVVTRTEMRLRARGAGFWVLAALFVALTFLALPTRSAGYAFMTAAHRGAFVYDSSFVGMVSGFICTMLFGLIGFFVAHNAMRRDRMTPAGEIIAATPVDSAGYLGGKYLSAVGALGTLWLVSLATAAVVQFVRGEAAVDLGSLLGPGLLLALPTLLYTAGLGVAAGALPLRGSGAALNLVYILYWLASLWGSLSVSRFTQGLWIGFTAFELPSFQLARAYHASTILGAAPPTSQLLQWPGLEAGLCLAPRLAYAFLGPAAVALALLWFRRFDPAPRR